MKQTFILSLFLISFSLVALSQSKEEEEGSDTIPKLKGNRTCIYKKKYTAEQRKKNFPFNLYDSVQLVSFRYQRNNYPIKEDAVIVDSLIETKLLNSSELNILTDIFYNNFYKKAPNYGVSDLCFTPRNAIIFYNKEGNPVEYMLLCFHCRNYELSSAEMAIGENCDKKMEKLRNFFITMGVKFGTDISINEYPGEDDGLGKVAPPLY